MKGLELPINMIIVIAIAVLVLVAISAFFISNFSGSTNTINEQQAFISGCNNLRSLYQCKAENVNSVCIQGYNPQGQAGQNYGLGYLCKKNGALDTVQCAKLCGCTVLGDSNPVPVTDTCR